MEGMYLIQNKEGFDEMRCILYYKKEVLAIILNEYFLL
jgi:hypothetical protein